MQKVIGFSSGDIYSWAPSINEQIEVLKKIPCNAIEINYAGVPSLNEEITEENIDYLHSPDYVSIHAPFYGDSRSDLMYENNDATAGILRKLKGHYDRIGARAIVFHPNLIGDYSIFKGFDFNACLENMPFARKISPKEFIALAGEHPEFGIVIDTAHALSWGENALGMLVRQLGRRTLHVHLSDRRYSQRKQTISDHRQMLYADDMNKFEVVRNIDCPLILEVSIKDKKNNVQNLKDEYEFVKKFFSN